MNPLAHILQSLPSISLEEMSAVKLMNRTDTKYLLNQQALEELALRWQGLFHVQENLGLRTARYRTLYFDTPDAITYTIHQNQQLHRQKIRERIYVESNTCFLEIKNKVNTGRTKKKRIAIPMEGFGKLYDTPEKRDFLRERVWVTHEELHPRLQNAFQRITLVNRQKSERITIDSNIQYHNLVTGQDADTTGLVIVEVKQDGNCPSDFKRLLLDARIQSHGLSKYCLGMLLTDDRIKYNRFKPKVRFVSQLIGRPLEIYSLTHKIQSNDNERAVH